MTELKPGWCRVKFGDLVCLNKETSKEPAANGLERYVGLEHLEPGDLRVRSWGDVVEGTTFTNRFRPGHVLFGKRRAYQRKVAVSDFDGVCSGDIYVLEPIDPSVLLPELLPFLCQTDTFFEHAVGTSAGSLSPRTNWQSLAKYEFALPPLEEQRRIVALLGATKSMVETSATAMEAAETLERAFLQSEISQLFHPSVRQERVDKVGEVTMGRQRSPKYEGGTNPRPYLRVANVYDGFIDTTDVLEMDFNDAEFEKYTLKNGDVLLNEGQSRELVGRSSIFRDEVPKCCFQNTLIRFRPALVPPEFAHAVFRYWLYTGGFIRVSKQTTSIAHLGAKRFAAMRMPIPLQSVTGRIVEVLGCLGDVRDECAGRLSAAKATNSEILNRTLGGDSR